MTAKDVIDIFKGRVNQPIIVIFYDADTCKRICSVDAEKVNAVFLPVKVVTWVAEGHSDFLKLGIWVNK